ncbi:CpaF family protein [Candidatus Pacearchaeota archaeon]|nr:MAG: CpaF family protein [Candidatus Pacearchaeota archaeon]
MVKEEVRKKKEIEEERKAREGEKEKEGWEKEGEKKEEGEKKQEKVGEKREGKEEKKKGIKGTGTEGKLLERYKLNVDNAVTEVNIERTGEGIIYNLSLPEIGIGTQVLLEEIRKELVSTSTINLGELNDIKTIARMKKSFIEQTTKLLREKVPTISTEAEKFLVGMLIQEMLGLGKIEFLLNDPQLEEIVIISSKEPVRVYHKKYGWLKTNIKIEKEDDINNYANIIARRVGRQINVLTPLLDAHLITGDRANAVLFPIATKGNTITIRKFARDPWTIIDLINNKTVSLEVACLLWLAIEYEMNVLISGGTASGKTVFLNACMPFIPPNQRIISIEDTRELILPEFLYWCPLVTRTPNPEGKGEVSMLDLLVNSLRMRPDRIILGEMRRQKEAEVLFEAMHTGHSVYATLHADTASETISRLTNPPLNVPPNLLKAVNLNVVMFRDRRKGVRRVYQVAEFVPEKGKVSPNILYRWVPEKDEVIKHNESVAFLEDLSRNTGMSQAEIKKDLENKKKILLWLIKNKLRSLKDIGKVINLYYINPNLLAQIMKKNNIKELQ